MPNELKIILNPEYLQDVGIDEMATSEKPLKSSGFSTCIGFFTSSSQGKNSVIHVTANSDPDAIADELNIQFKGHTGRKTTIVNASGWDDKSKNGLKFGLGVCQKVFEKTNYDGEIDFHPLDEENGYLADVSLHKNHRVTSKYSPIVLDHLKK